MNRTLNAGLIAFLALSFSACAQTETTPNTTNIVDADESNFQQILGGATTPVLIDVWASWCGPCRMIKPVVEQSAAQYAGKLLVVRVDADKAPNLTDKYAPKGLPTLVVLNKACPTPATQVGYGSDQETQDFISAAISGCPDGKPHKTINRDAGVGLFVMRSSMIHVYATLPRNPSIDQVKNAFRAYIRQGLPTNATKKQLAEANTDMTMAPITVEDPLVVAAVAHKGAAKKAGIVAGDRIVAVDGISVYGRPFMSLTRSFAGTKKSVLKLTIEHASGSSIERKEVSLQRGKVTGLFD